MAMALAWGHNRGVSFPLLQRADQDTLVVLQRTLSVLLDEDDSRVLSRKCLFGNQRLFGRSRLHPFTRRMVRGHKILSKWTAISQVSGGLMIGEVKVDIFRPYWIDA